MASVLVTSPDGMVLGQVHGVSFHGRPGDRFMMAALQPVDFSLRGGPSARIERDECEPIVFVVRELLSNDGWLIERYLELENIRQFARLSQLKFEAIRHVKHIRLGVLR